MIRIYKTFNEFCDLDYDSIRKAGIHDISFHRCILNKLDFTESILYDIDMRSAEMNESVFYNSIIVKSRLIMVNSLHANYTKCKFDESMIMHSDFSYSSFNMADLSKSILRNSKFDYCDFRGCNLSCESIEDCSFVNAIYDDNTTWPVDFLPSEHRLIKKQNH